MSQPRDFGFGDDEVLLRDQVKKLLDERGSIEKLRALVARDHDLYEKGAAPGWDEATWSTMVELGLPALAVPERAGGLGAKKVAIAAVAEQMGLHAFPSPLLATLAAAEVLTACGTEAADAALARIASGVPFALATMDAHGSSDVRHTEVTAHRDDASGYRLEGTACYVQDGDKAGAFVVAARDGSSIVFAVVERDAAGVEIVRDRIVDLTRGQVRVRFSGTKVSSDAVVATGDASVEAYARAMPSLLVLVAADLVGISEWQLRTTTEYAKVREQFGRPIGSFQAVKHPIVDMMIGIDQARSLLYAAACAIDTEPAEAEMLARMAKAKASDVGRFCSGRSVQLHGGIGFTWEADLHLFFKRSEHDQVLLGDGATQRRHIAARLFGA